MTKLCPVSMLLLASVIFFASGCAPYVLRGRVIDGPMSVISVVDADDPRLEAEADGIPNAALTVTKDPKWLKREQIGSGTTDLYGEFAIPIEEFGAGGLDIETAVSVAANNYRPASKDMLLPRSDKRLIIMLSRVGRRADQPKESETYLEETLKLRDEYLRRLR